MEQTENKIIIDKDATEMTFIKLKETVESYALLLSCKWYGELGIPRNKIQELIDDV